MSGISDDEGDSLEEPLVVVMPTDVALVVIDGDGGGGEQ